MAVNILTMGYWPTYTPVEVNLPGEVCINIHTSLALTARSSLLLNRINDRDIFTMVQNSNSQFRMTFIGRLYPYSLR